MQIDGPCIKIEQSGLISAGGITKYAKRTRYELYAAHCEVFLNYALFGDIAGKTQQNV